MQNPGQTLEIEGVATAPTTTSATLADTKVPLDPGAASLALLSLLSLLFN